MRVYGPQDLDKIPQLAQLKPDDLLALRVVSQVLPFKTNDYVINKLIDWSKAPNDPIFRLTFMQEGMLAPTAFDEVASAMRREASVAEIAEIVARIRRELNPHPSGQLTHNVPMLDGKPVKGIQHKYPETVLVFPSAGQTCFAYCTFCFRWAQFVGDKDLTFATDAQNRHLEYIKAQKGVTDVLFTGGDPMIMRARHLAHFIEPLLGPGFEHVQTIRIGTKVLSYWPQRFLDDRDSEEVLDLFARIVKSGKQLAIMTHINHPQEMATTECHDAILKLREVGATIRCQSPLLRQVNDDASTWVKMWNEQVRLGMIPYYMFVERDTGPKQYFEVPLWRAHAIFTEAYSRVSGLARTVRGPSMSATPGKVCIEGTAVVAGKQVFVLKFIQGRDPNWCGQPFFAAFDPNATWFDELVPAFGEATFFFEESKRRGAAVVNGDEALGWS